MLTKIDRLGHNCFYLDESNISVMSDYYSKNLSGNRLKKCYDLASERVKQYLDSEIEEVKHHISRDDRVIELGCGYGRVMKSIADDVESIYGIDISFSNLSMAISFLNEKRNCILFQMDATAQAFPDAMFDVTLCIQNGISAFSVDPKILIQESLRITRNGGFCVFSSYSDKFWLERLEWFQVQSNNGLLGTIDMYATRDGKIVCADGFVATTFTMKDFQNLSKLLNVKSEIYEVDQSSIFCILEK